MSTLEEQMATHDYPNKEVFLVSYYIFLLLVYVSGGAIIGGFIILGVYKSSKREKLRMIKKYCLHRMLHAVRVIAILEIANSFIVLAWAYNLSYYAKILGEFLCAIILFFVRETYVFRWLAMLFNVGMMIIQVVFMVWVMTDLYCYKNDLCGPKLSEFAMYLMYSQFCIAFILESIVIVLTTNMMMSLGWFYTEHFPPQLNLEQYNIQRPDKKSSIYDMFPHPVNYEF